MVRLLAAPLRKATLRGAINCVGAVPSFGIHSGVTGASLPRCPGELHYVVDYLSPSRGSTAMGVIRAYPCHCQCPSSGGVALELDLPCGVTAEPALTVKGMEV